ncbi:hypothetical protein GF380_03405 [Candidatus Uhrbacteria bacterium]|nr:hypothetical protein [Candidatus Uhrbacteria bacterium]MBD3284179.1 hypothetical protein [Candidatus Uhrbacteria bacterium]
MKGFVEDLKALSGRGKELLKIVPHLPFGDRFLSAEIQTVRPIPFTPPIERVEVCSIDPDGKSRIEYDVHMNHRIACAFQI